MNLKELGSCPMKAYWSSLGLASTRLTARNYIRSVIRNILQDDGLDGFDDIGVITFALEKGIPEGAYAMETEREENIRLMADRLYRMYLVLNTNGFAYVGTGKRYAILENGKELTGSYDMVLRRNGVDYAVKIVNKSDFSSDPKTKSWIGNDPDLYVMYKATGLNPALYALQGKTSGNAEVDLNEDFTDPKKWEGKFWFETDFAAEHEEAAKRLEALTNIPVTKTADKNEKECAMCYFSELCKYEDTDNDDVEVISTEPASFEIPVWTETQKEILEHTEGELRVLAGAGSGKTSTLICRLAGLVEKGVKPEETLSVTFTEKAVGEMKERLEKYTTVPVDRFRITTFNGLGYRIVRDNWQALGYSEMPTLIDDSDKIAIVSEIMDNSRKIPGLNYLNPFMKMFKAEGAVHQMIRMINAIKRVDTKGRITKVKAKKVLSGVIELDDEYWKDIASIYNKVVKVERERNLLEYDDQIHYAVKLFKEHPEIAEQYRGKYRHITIDEFQDTGLDQMDMVNFLYKKGEGNSLLVCGDDSQSIYGFRGVSNENIVNFDKTYPGSKTITMAENFRSTSQILSVANALISRNGITKQLTTAKSGKSVYIRLAKNREEGVTQAVNEVCRWVDEGVQLSDIALLARTRAEILEARRQLREALIPNVVSVSEYLRNDNQMIGVMALAGWIEDKSNIRDLAIWLRHANHADFDSQYDIATYLALHSAELNEVFKEKSDEEKYREFRSLININLEWKASPSLKTWLAMEDEKEPSMTRACEFLRRLRESNSNLSAQAEEVVYDAVTLSTIHAAKGKEWKYVAVCANGLESGVCTAELSGRCKLEYPEESIRTYFVGVTRAREELVISCNKYWNCAFVPQIEYLHIDTLKECGVKVDDPFKKERDKAKRKK